MKKESGEKLQLDNLGYNSFFERSRNELGLAVFDVGRVTSESKGAYRVKNESGEYQAQVTGKHIFQASSRESYPAVGDWVAIEILNADQAVIRGLLSRLTVLKRKHGDKTRLGKKDEVQIIAANIDEAFVVESVDRDYSLNRFERYFAIAKSGGVKPVIILNKVDLLSPEELAEKMAELKNRFPSSDIIAASTVSDRGLDHLEKYLAEGKTYCFLGSSGVGKSSLVNKLLHKDVIPTGEISSHSDRGRHVTTSRHMYFLKNGAIVIDNPGVREVGMTEGAQEVDTFFDEITALAQRCKYADCAHTHEPGCKVIEAVKTGKLDKEKYSNYLNLKKETEYAEMTDLEKRESDRQFGKFRKNAKKDFKEFGM